MQKICGWLKSEVFPVCLKFPYRVREKIITKTMKYKEFVILVCSYNNEKWYKKNLSSILAQNYPYFRVLYTDAVSTDSTAELVEDYLKEYDSENRVSLIRNTLNRKQTANIFAMAYSCKDDEILVTADGDDWLAHENVLSRLNEVYQDDNVWMTWGSYADHPKMKKGLGALPFPDEIVENNAFRTHRWSLSHLRTFYCWLFKKIEQRDLMKDGEFFQMAGDLAFMFPMAEMCGGRFKYLDEILYIYNHENPLQEHKLDESLQLATDAHIRSMTTYRRLRARNSKGITWWMRLLNDLRKTWRSQTHEQH